MNSREKVSNISDTLRKIEKGIGKFMSWVNGTDLIDKDRIKRIEGGEFVKPRSDAADLLDMRLFRGESPFRTRKVTVIYPPNPKGIRRKMHYTEDVGEGSTDPVTVFLK